MVISHTAVFPKGCKCFVIVVSIRSVKLWQFLILINSRIEQKLKLSGVEYKVTAVTLPNMKVTVQNNEEYVYCLRLLFFDNVRCLI